MTTRGDDSLGPTNRNDWNNRIEGEGAKEGRSQQEAGGRPRGVAGRAGEGRGGRAEGGDQAGGGTRAIVGDGRARGVGARAGAGRRLPKREAERERARHALVSAVAALGQPRELGEMLAGMLRTPKAMDRLTRYLMHVRPPAPEAMVDEALAIMQDRKTWQERKISENANAAYTRFVNLPRDEDGNVL